MLLLLALLTCVILAALLLAWRRFRSGTASDRWEFVEVEAEEVELGDHDPGTCLACDAYRRKYQIDHVDQIDQIRSDQDHRG